MLDTALLARRVLTRDEVPNCKLSTLARFFSLRHHAQPPGAGRRPGHRRRAARPDRAAGHAGGALAAGAARLHLPGLRRPAPQAAPGRRAAARARGLPVQRRRRARRSTSAPARTCAAGCGSTSWRRRPAAGWARWWAWPSRSSSIVCAHPLEAQVRELRLITSLKPRYNRRSKHGDRTIWLKFTREPFPRLSMVHQARTDGAQYFGPLRSTRQAEQLRDAIHDAVPLRQCTDRLAPGRPVRSRLRAGRHRQVRRALRGRAVPAGLRRAGRHRRAGLAGRRRDADRAAAGPVGGAGGRPALRRGRRSCATGSPPWCAAAPGCRRWSRSPGIAELVAARPDGSGGWELVVIRHGRLVGADVAACGVPPMPLVAALLGLRRGRRPRPPTRRPWPPPPPWRRPSCCCAGSTSPAPGWSRPASRGRSPAAGAARLRSWLASADGARRSAHPFADRRRLPVTHQPIRSAAGSRISA